MPLRKDANIGLEMWSRETRDLSAAARGCWPELFFTMDRDQNQGIVSGSTVELASIMRVGNDQAARIIDEFAEKKTFVVSRSAQGVTPSVTLLSRTIQTAWASRAKASQRQKKRREEGKIKQACHASVIDASRVCHNHVPSPPVSPSSSLSPYTPLSYSTHSPPPSSSFSSTASPPSENGGKPRGRKCTDEQVAMAHTAHEWWVIDAWPASHGGVVYEWDGADWAALWKILKSKSIAWDLEKFKSLARYFLRQPEEYGLQGHPFRMLGQKLNHYSSDLARGIDRSVRPIKKGNSYEQQRAAKGDTEQLPLP